MQNKYERSGGMRNRSLTLAPAQINIPPICRQVFCIAER
jgi:hypothetical protein